MAGRGCKARMAEPAPVRPPVQRSWMPQPSPLTAKQAVRLQRLSLSLPLVDLARRQLGITVRYMSAFKKATSW